MIRIQDGKKVEALFYHWQETLIWSCLQGVMGQIYGDDPEQPEAAMCLLGDFCFLAGRPKRELVIQKPKEHSWDFMILVPQNEQWGKLIEECWQEKARKVTRYALKKEPQVFEREKLWKAVEALPREYELRKIGKELYTWCREHSWSRDLVSQYPSYQDYEDLGLGFMVLKDGIPAAGASSYSSYAGGIEIEIDTKEEYRRKGLAYACGARLILECLNRGLYPSWDAQNLGSLALAEKLGYHYAHDYTAYEILDPVED